MCGIAGYVASKQLDQFRSDSLLVAVRDSMRSRGPDGAGLWRAKDGSVGLAHRRLAIIDLTASGAQPMALRDGSLRIVFNGEIYNYRALRQHLEGLGRHFESNSDTEVLLHLYAVYGEQMLQRIRGMFAFAIWDQGSRELFLARDPFGVKPLYFAHCADVFFFASQVRALLKVPFVNTSEEPAGHAGFFLWGHVPEPFTLYKGIRALPAGTSLRLGEDFKVTEKKFFSVREVYSRPPEPLNKERISVSLRDGLKDSIHHHLVSDVPVGVFLSSGLDSTSLASLVTEASSKPPQTITLGFKEYIGTANDETPLAAEFSAAIAARHQTVWTSKSDFTASFDHLMNAMDQPSTDGVNSYFVSKAASQAGLKVALSGLGGDELFGGYPSFRDIPRMVGLLRYPARADGFGRGFRIVTAPMLRHMTSPKYAGLFEYGGTFEGAYLLRRGMFMPWELPDVLDPDLAAEGWKGLQTLVSLRKSYPDQASSFGKVQTLEMTWYMRNQLLRDTDWASMAHSVEIRVPFIDVELFRYVAQIAQGGVALTKRDLVSSLANPLPQAVLSKHKSGFSIPVPIWLGSINASFTKHRGLRGWAQFVHGRFVGGPHTQPEFSPAPSM